MKPCQPRRQCQRAALHRARQGNNLQQCHQPLHGPCPGSPPAGWALLVALRAGGRTFPSDPKPKPRLCLENIAINKPQNPRTKHVGTVLKRASSLVQEEFPAPMLENETKSEFQGVGEKRAPFAPQRTLLSWSNPTAFSTLPPKTPPPSKGKESSGSAGCAWSPPAPASPALCTAEQSFTLLINQKLARKKVGQVNKDRLFFFFFCTEANNISKNTLVLVFSGFCLILFIYLWQQVEGSSPTAAPPDDSPSSIPARCSPERRDEEERGESRKISPRGLGRRQGTAGGCRGKAGRGEQPRAAPGSVCARVSARARLRHDLLPERSQTPRCQPR